MALGVAATLLLPSATWYHYLAPLTAARRFRLAASDAPRPGLLIVTGATSVTIGLLFLPLAVAGARVVVGGALLASGRDDVRRQDEFRGRVARRCRPTALARRLARRPHG